MAGFVVRLKGALMDKKPVGVLYRMRPIYTRAVHWTGDNLEYVQEFTGPDEHRITGGELEIPTPIHGWQKVPVGDWIFRVLPWPQLGHMPNSDFRDGYDLLSEEEAAQLEERLTGGSRAAEAATNLAAAKSDAGNGKAAGRRARK